MFSFTAQHCLWQTDTIARSCLLLLYDPGKNLGRTLPSPPKLADPHIHLGLLALHPLLWHCSRVEASVKIDRRLIWKHVINNNCDFQPVLTTRLILHIELLRHFPVSNMIDFEIKRLSCFSLQAMAPRTCWENTTHQEPFNRLIQNSDLEIKFRWHTTHLVVCRALTFSYLG